MSQVQHYFDQLKGNSRVLIAYSGGYQDNLFNTLLSIAEEKLKKVEFKPKIRKRVFNILVEVFQNIQNHYNFLEENAREDYEMFVVLEKEGHVYTIISGNNILKSTVTQLKSRIDEINMMTYDEIVEKYRKRLDVGEMTESGGAGLGMLDIVRKSKDKLKYHFENINDKLSFFQLTVNINA